MRVADVQRQLRSGAEVVMRVQGLLQLHLREPGGAAGRDLLVMERPGDEIGRAGAGLQAALSERPFAVRHVGLAGGQLETEERAGRAGGGIRAFQGSLIAPRHARVAHFAEIPLLGQLRSAMVVDVQVVAIDNGQRGRNPPARRPGVAVGGDQVAVDRVDLVVMVGDFTHRNLLRTGPGLILRDVLVAQVECAAFRQAGGTRAPVGVDGAKSGAAACLGRRLRRLSEARRQPALEEMKWARP